ncbi:large-conductance mechanosensitive channel protein MscL [Nannocystis sp.]|uniref:large-conductance mechanosensitive channel protein MscL n=1 Tax=Nannocystis sp. TaxID=1962667 RepID=UPI002425D512|nr:large-conductance mechanosensitive channel protein MscL [Nannocystis sp.]MBK7825556.1 large-conductance mechanosensitive channel protein MscL [Nannocystis sp.]MBK9756731.1 large-conductance mechanosensitive channel protein MscL [Nannocystis sp.]
MSFMSEFKAFAVRGNVVDLAVGVIIGGAFGKIVASFVADVVMPPIGLAIGGVDFSKLQLVLQQSSDPAKIVAIRYGMFLQATLDFIIVALVIFMMVKLVNRTRRQHEVAAPPPAPNPQEVLLTEIRDLLRDQRR